MHGHLVCAAPRSAMAKCCPSPGTESTMEKSAVTPSARSVQIKKKAPLELAIRSEYIFRYVSCAIAPVGRCCSILLWHLLLLLPGSRLDPLRGALSLAGHLAAGLPGKPETGVTPLQPGAHRGSTGRSRRIVICAAPNIPARLRAHLVVPYRL